LRNFSYCAINQIDANEFAARLISTDIFIKFIALADDVDKFSDNLEKAVTDVLDELALTCAAKNGWTDFRDPPVFDVQVSMRKGREGKTEKHEPLYFTCMRRIPGIPDLDEILTIDP
jgi:hypothetical protein